MILTKEVKAAKAPSANLATIINLKINSDSLQEQTVTTEESDSEDSAVRVALSEASDSASEASDSEIEAIINGNSVSNTENSQQNKTDDLIENVAQKITIEPFLTNGLTVPSIHDYATDLAEAEVDSQQITPSNGQIIQHGWKQMITEIRNNTNMCRNFVNNYQGRIDLTTTQVASWITKNHHKFHKHGDIHEMMISLKNEFEKSKSPQDNILSKKQKIPHLGQEWRVIPKKATPSSIRITRNEYTSFLVNKLNRLFATNPHSRMAMRKAEPWLRRSLNNQALFEDKQQSINTAKPFGTRGKRFKINKSTG